MLSCRVLNIRWVWPFTFTFSCVCHIQRLPTLGRLLYTTGNVAGAVRFFLGLLRGSTVSSPSPIPLPVNGNANGESNIPGTDKVFLDDFRVAFTVRTGRSFFTRLYMFIHVR
jgi:hypothetical protein